MTRGKLSRRTPAARLEATGIGGGIYLLRSFFVFRLRLPALNLPCPNSLRLFLRGSGLFLPFLAVPVPMNSELLEARFRLAMCSSSTQNDGLPGRSSGAAHRHPQHLGGL